MESYTGWPSEPSQKVAAAGNHEREQRGDDGALLHGRAAFDGVELLHHLRQSPGAQAGQDHDAQQVQRVGPEHAHERAVHGGQIGRNARQLVDGLGEPAVVHQDGHNDRDDAQQHDDALQKVVHDRGHVAADDHIDAGDRRHADHACLVGQAERHAEQTRQAVVDARRVRDEEHEDDGCRRNAQALRPIPLPEEFRHGGGAQAVRHLARARPQHPPGKKAAQDGVADACPQRGDAVFPSELAGVAHEHHGREIAGTERERRHPGPHVAAAQHEPVHALGRPSTVNAHAHGHADEYEHHAYLCDHNLLAFLSCLARRALRAFFALAGASARPC